MGGGSGGPSSSTTYTSNLPEYAKPYFERMMARTEAESNQPYVGYKENRLAGFTGDTQAGFQATRDIAARGTPESAQAIQIAGQAGAAGAGDINAARGMVGTSGGMIGQANQMVGSTLAAGAPQMQSARQVSYDALAAGAPDVSQARSLASQATVGGMPAANAQRFAQQAVGRGFNAGDYASNAIRQSAFTGESAGQYMSPYMENVVEAQRKAAVRNFEEGRPARESQAIRSGAFGGYRSWLEVIPMV